MAKIYITGSESTRGYITGSGYLNNPARILLRDKDHHTGSYPSVARTGDPDFLGNKNVSFDDTSTIEFFSSYATAEIDFTAIPPDAALFSLTGSSGTKKEFEIQKGVIQSYAGSTIIDLTDQSNLTEIGVASKLSAAINDAAMGIEATTKGSTVKLRQHQPLVGTYKLGNLIQTASYYGFPISATIKQFAQHGPENYLYPFNLDSNSQFINKRIATPSTSGSIVAPAIMRSGISDTEISFTPGENISAFNETRISIDNNDPFYQESISPTVLPGFNQRLGSKIAIEIDISPTESTDVYFSTGTVAHSTPYADNAAGLAAGINSGLAYFNFADKKWDIVGNITTGSNVDYFNEDIIISTGSMLAIAPASWAATATPGSNYSQLNMPIGSPSNFAGFPLAQKFDASSSQQFNTSGRITSPFLVEKIKLEFSGALGSYITEPNKDQPHNSTFMLLLQRDTTLNATYKSSAETITHYDPTHASVVRHETYFPVAKDKRIIWRGRIGVFEQGGGANSFLDETTFSRIEKEKYSACETWVATAGSLHPTGSYSVCGVPEIMTKTPRVEEGYYPRSGMVNYPLFGKSNSGRNLSDISDGRSFIRTSIGAKPIGVVKSTAVTSSPSTPFEIDVYDKDAVESPFLLLPGDKLVLAHANQLYPGHSGDLRESKLKEYKTTLAPGFGKLTLFGSHIRNNLPVESGLNQPLTSDAIHEDIRDDSSPYGEARCLDQWIVEPDSSYRGGYLDNIITGSMHAGLGAADPGIFKNPFTADVRKVQASVIDGQAGTTGSLQRFVRVVDSKKTVYDSHVPNLAEIIKHYDITRYEHANIDTVYLSTYDIYGADGGASYDITLTGSHRYTKSAMFENISHIRRASSLAGLFSDSNNDSVAIDSVGYFTSGSIPANLSPNEKWVSITGGGTTNQLGSHHLVLKSFLGIGDWNGLPKPTNYYGKSTVLLVGFKYMYSDVVARGTKYGLYNFVPTSPTHVFRHDTFGQFRDMLEQGIHTRFFDDGSLDPVAPVQVSFRSRSGEAGVSPTSTNSQNLDLFATSSVPYFDGNSRDRISTQPDLLPQVDVEITL